MPVCTNFQTSILGGRISFLIIFLSLLDWWAPEIVLHKTLRRSSLASIPRRARMSERIKKKRKRIQ